MAISFVGANSAAADNVAIPTHQAGDLIVGTGYSDVNGVVTKPAAWTGLSQGVAGGFGRTCAFIIASSSGTTSGTWTNATELCVQVYRGAVGIGSNSPVSTNGNSASINYPTVTLDKTDGTSWVGGVAIHRSATNVETAPAGMTNRSSTGSTPEAACHDTNGGVASWSAVAASVNASNTWQSTTYEVLAQNITPVSALAASASNARLTTAKAKLFATASASFARLTSSKTPSFVGYASAATSSVTLPAHQTGDIIIIGAYRNNAATAPTLPAGYTQIQTGAANTNAMISGWKRAASSGEVSGTWTGATNIEAVVYRNSRGVGASAQNGSTGTSVNFPALTLNEPAVASWVGAFSGHRLATNMEVPPTLMTNRGSQGAGPEIAAHDTNAVVASWASTNSTVNGNSGWRTTVFEILGPPTTTNKAIAAATASMARLTTVFGKFLPTSSASVARLTPSVTKTLRASSASVASLLKSTSKTFLVSTASNARLQRSFSLAFFAASNAVAAILTVFVPGGLTFQASSASMARESHQSTFTRTLLASSSSVATLQRIALLRLSFSASSASLPSLTKSTAKTLLAASLTVALMFRTMPRSFNAQSAAVARLNRLQSLVLLARSAAAASLMKIAAKMLQASSAAEARLQKATTKRLQASSASQSSFQRTLTLNMAFQALSQAVARFNITYQLSFATRSLSRAWFSLVSFIVPHNVPGKRTVKPSMRDRVANPERSRTVTPRRRNRIVTPD